MRRNPYYDPSPQTSVFPPRENIGLRGYKLISTQLISLFSTMFQSFPPAENERNTIDKATDISVISKVLEQLQSKWGSRQPRGKGKYRKTWEKINRNTWRNHCNESTLCKRFHHANTKDYKK